MAAVGFILTTSALEDTGSKKRWVRMVDNPDTFGIPAHSITRMEISVQADVREGAIVKCVPWLVVTSEDETDHLQRYWFNVTQRLIPDIYTRSPRLSVRMANLQSIYAELARQIWKVRFRYELFWLIGQQLLHYLPAQTPIKVMTDWIAAWRSRMPLTEPVRVLNAILAAAPSTAASSPVRRYEDVETQAFYHLQRFKALPSIATDQVQNWEDAANASLAPVCFGCWAQNAPFAKTCVACGTVLQ